MSFFVFHLIPSENIFFFVRFHTNKNLQRGEFYNDLIFWNFWREYERILLKFSQMEAEKFPLNQLLCFINLYNHISYSPFTVSWRGIVWFHWAVSTCVHHHIVIYRPLGHSIYIFVLPGRIRGLVWFAF